MPINEQVIDALAHILGHWFESYTDEELSAEALADFAVAQGACDHCIGSFIWEAGGHDFADAIVRVWESPLWHAFVARQMDEED